jgi:hypothetical protein
LNDSETALPGSSEVRDLQIVKACVMTNVDGNFYRRKDRSLGMQEIIPVGIDEKKAYPVLTEFVDHIIVKYRLFQSFSPQF